LERGEGADPFCAQLGKKKRGSGRRGERSKIPGRAFEEEANQSAASLVSGRRESGVNLIGEIPYSGGGKRVKPGSLLN